MEFSTNLKIICYQGNDCDNESMDIVQSDNGTKYYLSSIIVAINEFNKKCPKRGGMIERSEIGACKNFTHVTNSLRYDNGKMIADIDLNNKYDPKHYMMKPIIAIPLRFGSGIDVERVIKIVNIFLEEI